MLWLCLSCPWLCLSCPWLSFPWLCLKCPWLSLGCVQDPKTGLSFQFVGRVDFSPMVIRKSAMQQVGGREQPPVVCDCVASQGITLVSLIRPSVRGTRNHSAPSTQLFQLLVVVCCNSPRSLLLTAWIEK